MDRVFNMFIVLVFVALAVYMIMINYIPKYDPYISNKLSDKVLLEEINDWRISIKKKPYILDPSLCGLAEDRLNDIQKDFSHDKFYPRSESLFKSDEEIMDLGENLARGGDEEEIVKNWIYSKDHLDNLIKPFTHTCVRTEYNYAVQIFGSY